MYIILSMLTWAPEMSKIVLAKISQHRGLRCADKGGRMWKAGEWCSRVGGEQWAGLWICGCGDRARTHVRF